MTVRVTTDEDARRAAELERLFPECDVRIERVGL